VQRKVSNRCAGWGNAGVWQASAAVAAFVRMLVFCCVVDVYGLSRRTADLAALLKMLEDRRAWCSMLLVNTIIVHACQVRNCSWCTYGIWLRPPFTGFAVQCCLWFKTAACRSLWAGLAVLLHAFAI
jgi:hypothetical protein